MTDFERRQWIKGIIKRIMRSWGLDSQKALARHLELNEYAVYNWVQNSTVPWSTVLECSQQTGRTLDWLITGIEPEICIPEAEGHKVQKRLCSLMSMAQKMKLINEHNPNGLNTLADKLTDEIGDIVKDFAIMVIDGNQKN